MNRNGRKIDYFKNKNAKENDARGTNQIPVDETQMIEQITNQYSDEADVSPRSKNKAARHHWVDDSITQEQLHQVFKACERTEEALENKYAVITTGKLGMREGESTHMQLKWIDFEEKVIRIPPHDPCDCAYCIVRWKKKLGRKGRTTIFSMEMVAKEQWTPKYPASIRTIPFGFDPEIEDILQDFFKKCPRWPYTENTMRVRVRMLGKMVGIQKLGPHPLRCTTATKFALDGMNAFVLTRVMGWKDIAMAVYYVNKAGIHIKEEFEKIYGKKKLDLKKDINYRVFYLTPKERKFLARKRRPNEYEWLKNLIIPEEDSRTQQSMLSENKTPLNHHDEVLSYLCRVSSIFSGGM